MISFSVQQDSMVNLDQLAKQVSQHVIDRPFYETRHGFEEDDGLIGILNLCTAVIKHKPPFKSSPEGQVSNQWIQVVTLDLKKM